MTRLRLRPFNVLAIVLAAAVMPLPAGAAKDVTEPFAVKVKGVTSPLRVMSIFVMPEERVAIEAVGKPRNARFAVDAKQGALVTRAFDRWDWQAPVEPGAYRLKVQQLGTKDDIDLTAFVMVPATRARDGWLNGYHIGDYPDRPLNANPLYAPPRGFIEVTNDNKDTRVTPRFRLRQFLCKQDAKYPKYLVLREGLLLTLERLVDELNRSGIHAGGLHVMSGYRTPYYNHAIGNVQLSLHQFGGAADVFVDEDDDGRMDDVNRDHKIDRSDALVIHEILERIDRDEPSLVGGLGLYAATNNHGPFVHVDIRAGRARW